MASKQRSQLAFGLIVLLVGIWLLSVQLIPGLRSWAQQFSTWPMIMIGAGGILLLLGLFTREGDLLVVGCLVATVGGILLANELTDNYLSWSYAWALIPGSVGLGEVLSGLLNGQRSRVTGGLNTIATSVILFIIFAAFFGGLTWLGPYWPVLVILAGLWLLVRAFWRK